MCVDTYASSYVQKYTVNPGATAELAAERKHNKYKTIEENQYNLIALSIKTYGSNWCQKMTSFINDNGRNMAMQTGHMKTVSHFKDINNLLKYPKRGCGLNFGVVT